SRGEAGDQRSQASDEGQGADDVLRSIEPEWIDHPNVFQIGEGPGQPPRGDRERRDPDDRSSDRQPQRGAPPSGGELAGGEEEEQRDEARQDGEDQPSVEPREESSGGQ